MIKGWRQNHGPTNIGAMVKIANILVGHGEKPADWVKKFYAVFLLTGCQVGHEMDFSSLVTV